jgi:hypothetical protein
MTELKVQASLCEPEPMVQSENIRAAFSGRLKQALSHAGIAEWGAGTRLAGVTEKTAKAASKWLNAESMPSRGNMIAIAEWLGVRLEWLAHGEGPMQAGQAVVEAPVAMLERASIAMDGIVTPRSRESLQRIAKAAADGRLTDDDMALLDLIAAKIAGQQTPRPKGPNQRIAEKIKDANSALE